MQVFRLFCQGLSGELYDQQKVGFLEFMRPNARRDCLFLASSFFYFIVNDISQVLPGGILVRDGLEEVFRNGHGRGSRCNRSGRLPLDFPDFEDRPFLFIRDQQLLAERNRRHTGALFPNCHATGGWLNRWISKSRELSPEAIRWSIPGPG